MQRNESKKYIFWLVFAVAVFARVWQFGTIPLGLNQDEAFAAYDAWSIMTAGIDSAGYRYPVYLTAWGSGMNALETYLMIPLFALFGMDEWVIRLPQLIVGLLSVITVYFLGKRMAGEKMGLCFMALLAICPWHVMLSRWALESNLAPGFVLFGLYFFVKGLENSKWFLLSALMYGLSLYCYATIWPIVPLLLLMQLIYCRKKIRFDRFTVSSVALLALIAAPLLLFMAINYGNMEEIKTSFISVPELVVVRSDEISISNIWDNTKNTLRILLRQTDGSVWNGAKMHGILYHASLPLFVLGLCCSVADVRKNRKKPCLEGFMLIWFAGAMLLGILIHANVNRINIIFTPLVFFTAKGALQLCEHTGKPAKIALPVMYAMLFAAFMNYYFTQFPDLVKYHFNEGVESALQAVEDRDGDVYLDESVFHSQVLFYTKTPQKEFAETVVYKKYPDTYLHAKSFGRFIFDIDARNPDENANYILRKESDIELFRQLGYTMEEHGVYTLAYK